MVEINLLNQRRQQILKKQQKGSQYTKISIGVLLVSVASFIGILVLNSQTEQRISQVATEISTAESRISTYRQLVLQHNAIKNRIALVETLFKDKEVYDAKLRLFDQLYTNQGIATINRFSFGGTLSANEFEFGGRSGDLGNYHRFTTLLSSLTESFSITSVILNQLTRNKESLYVFSYLVTL